MRCRFFVCYALNGQGPVGAMRDTVVTVEVPETVEQLPAVLKAAVHPDCPPDPSDGFKGRRSSDVVLVQFQCLESLAAALM